MMKKLFLSILTLALFVAFAGVSYAGSVNYPASRFVKFVDGTSEVWESYTEVKRVRYGAEGLSIAGITSGAVCIWDTNSSDGVTVTRALGNNYDERFAGIAVTAIATQDVGGTADIKDDNYGYIAVQGYCIASIDEAITVGAGAARLAVASTGGLRWAEDDVASQDVAILLQTSTANANYEVWIK
jgi:hypothetical protein